MASENTGNPRPPEAAVAIPLAFGGDGGTYQATGNTARQQLVVYSGDLIDSIAIGMQKFGGKGGELQFATQIPPDGVILLTRLGTRGKIVSFLELVIDGFRHQAGREDGNDCMLEMPPTPVKFSGMFSGEYVDKVVFDLVQKPVTA